MVGSAAVGTGVIVLGASLFPWEKEVCMADGGKKGRTDILLHQPLCLSSWQRKATGTWKAVMSSLIYALVLIARSSSSSALSTVLPLEVTQTSL